MFEVIQTIAEQYGRGVLADGRKLLAFHADMAPMEKKEHLMLEYLITCDGHTTLLKVLNASSKEQKQAMNVLSEKMTEQVLVSETVAREIIEHYWKAIGGMPIAKNSTKDAESPEYVPIMMERDPQTGNWSGVHSGTAKQRRGFPVMIGLCAALVVAIIFFAATGSQNEKTTGSGNNSEQAANAHSAAEMEQLNATLREYEAAGNYQAIISTIKNGNYSDAETMAVYDRAVANYKAEMIASAETYLAAEDYTSAKSVLNTLKNYIGEEVQISQMLNEIEQKEVMEAVLSYEAEGNYKEAIVYLNNHGSAVSANAELQTKLSTFTEKYRSSVINEASSAYQKNGYQEAVSVLRSAQKVLPNDAAISNELARYTAAAPVSLLQLDCIKQGEYIEVGPYNSNLCKDVNGNTYAKSGVICLDEYKSGRLHDGDSLRSITYYLGQNYDTLTGVLYRPYTTLSFEGDWFTDGRVEIYGDGVLLYEGKITQKTYDPISIQVDVSGIRELSLIFRGAMGFDTGDFGMYNWYSKCCLAEMMVEKEP